MYILFTFYHLWNWNIFYNCCDKKTLCHSLLAQILIVSLTILGILLTEISACKEFMKVANYEENVEIMTKLSTYQSKHLQLYVQLLQFYIMTQILLWYFPFTLCIALSSKSSLKFSADFSLLRWLFISPTLFSSSPYFI